MVFFPETVVDMLVREVCFVFGRVMNEQEWNFVSCYLRGWCAVQASPTSVEQNGLGLTKSDINLKYIFTVT